MVTSTKQFEYYGLVELGVLTNEKLYKINPYLNDDQINDTLTNFKWYNILNQDYIYSDEYVEQKGWEKPVGEIIELYADNKVVCRLMKNVIGSDLS